MNRDFDNQSDHINTSELEKCFLGRKQLPKETFKTKGKKEFVPSQVNKLAHVIYPTIIIDDDNLKRNFCYEKVQLAQKRHIELKKILKNLIDCDKLENQNQRLVTEPIPVIEIVSSENSNSIIEKNGSELGERFTENSQKFNDIDKENSSQSSANDFVMKIASSVSPNTKFKQIDLNIKDNQEKKQLLLSKKKTQNNIKNKSELASNNKDIPEQPKSSGTNADIQKIQNCSNKPLKNTKEKVKATLDNSNGSINYLINDSKDKDKKLPGSKTIANKKDQGKDETVFNHISEKNPPQQQKGKRNQNQKETEKVLKNKTLNTTKKYQLGILEQKSISNAEMLNIPFLTSDEAVIFHYYSIEIFKKEKFIEGKLFQTRDDLSSDEAFGIITQENFGVIPCFKLLIPIVINERSYNVEHIRITYIKSRKLKKKSFSAFATFHHKLFDDLYCRKENIVEDLDRLIRPECEERRYMVLPLMRASRMSDWEIVFNL